MSVAYGLICWPIIIIGQNTGHGYQPTISTHMGWYVIVVPPSATMPSNVDWYINQDLVDLLTDSLPICCMNISWHVHQVSFYCVNTYTTEVCLKYTRFAVCDQQLESQVDQNKSVSLINSN